MLNPISYIFIPGVILYTLLCGHTPFRRKNETNMQSASVTEKIMKRIKRSIIDTETNRWKLLSESAKDLIKRLLTVSPEKRIKLPEILVHDWLNYRQSDTLSNGHIVDTRLSRVSNSTSSTAEQIEVVTSSYNKNNITIQTKTRESSRTNPTSVEKIESTTSESVFNNSCIDSSVPNNASNQLSRLKSIESINSSPKYDLNVVNESKIQTIDTLMKHLNNNNEKYGVTMRMDEWTNSNELTEAPNDSTLFQEDIVENQSYNDLSSLHESCGSIQSIDESNGSNVGWFLPKDITLLRSINNLIRLKEFLLHTKHNNIPKQLPPTIKRVRNNTSRSSARYVPYGCETTKSDKGIVQSVPKRRRIKNDMQ